MLWAFGLSHHSIRLPVFMNDCYILFKRDRLVTLHSERDVVCLEGWKTLGTSRDISAAGDFVGSENTSHSCSGQRLVCVCLWSDIRNLDVVGPTKEGVAEPSSR